MKNWCYGAQPPHEGVDEVEEQLLLASRYRNRLVELELERRDKVAMAMRECEEYRIAEEELAAAEQSLEAAFQAVRDRRIAERSKATPNKEELATITAARGRKTMATKAMRVAKTAVKAHAATAIAAATAEHKLASVAARKESGLYWGNYLVVEDSAKTFGQGSPPRFRRHDGSGTIAVQIQNGMTVEQLTECNDSRVRLHLSKECEESLGASGKARRAKARCELWIRVKSDESKNPVWAKFNVQVHRAIPDGSKVKWVYLERRRVGPKMKWQVRMSIDEPVVARKRRKGFVVVHPAWRRMPDGSVRIATWRGSDGRAGELAFTSEDIAGRSLPDHLRSVRDQLLNKFAHGIREAISKIADPPEWLAKMCEHISRWRSPSRWAGLVHRLRREEQFDGDQELKRLIELWHRRDKHLYLWQSNQSAGWMRWRNDWYRQFARQLERGYAYVSVMQSEYAELKKKPDLETYDGADSKTRFNASAAAVSTLERYIKEAFGKDCLLEIDTIGVTTTCHLCSAVNEVGSEQYITCSGCGERYDVDEAGVANQYARAEAAANSLGSLASVMTQRLKAAKAPKVLSARQQAFRAARKRARVANSGFGL